MKRILAWLGSALFFLTSTLGTISCAGNQRMTETEVAAKINKVATDGASYEGPFLFNLDNKEQIKHNIHSYLFGTTTVSGYDNPSNFLKLITKMFMKKLHQEAPKIFRDFPQFSLSCTAVRPPYAEVEEHLDNFDIPYYIIYNLHPLNEIKQLYFYDGTIANIDTPATRPNLDNFIGKRAARMGEHILGKKDYFSFSFHQTSYLENTQERLDFLIDMYTEDTRPIVLYPGQNYDALNMFNVIKTDFAKLPSVDITSEENLIYIKKAIRSRYNHWLLEEDNLKHTVPSLKCLGVIDSYKASFSFVKYMPSSEIANDSIWSKCLNIVGDSGYNLDTFPFKNGIMMFDLELQFQSSGTLSSKVHKERIFINFLDEY